MHTHEVWCLYDTMTYSLMLRTVEHVDVFEILTLRWDSFMW